MKQLTLVHAINLFLVLCLLTSCNSFKLPEKKEVISAKQFKEQYQPHNMRGFVYDNDIHYFQSLYDKSTELAAEKLKFLLDHSKNDPDYGMIYTKVILSIHRKKAAKIIEVMSRDYQIYGLNLIKDKYALDLLYYLPDSLVDKIGGYLISLQNFGKESHAEKYIPVNMELNGMYNITEINSKWHEINPVISADGRTMYFVRDMHPDNWGYNSYQDIWYSTLDENNQWSSPVNIGSPLNDAGDNAVLGVTPDGNQLLLNGEYYKSGDKDVGFSMSYRTKDGWSYPETVNIINYSNTSNYLSLTWSNDGKKLLFSIEGKDSYGARDIYISFLNDNNEWSEPLNLGSDINTANLETSAFLAADNMTLYFSSDRPGGYGSTDLYVSTRLDSTWKKWSKPENVGSSINTSGFDAFYTISAQGDYAYLATDLESHMDIYSVKLPEKSKPKPVTLVRGKVMDKNNNPLEAKIIYEYLSDGKEAGIARSNPVDGSYRIVLPSGFNYGFRAEASGYISINDNLDVNDTSYKEIEKNLLLVPISKGSVVRLNNVFFQYGKTDLEKESYPELNRVAELLIQNPDIKIEINGHTDNVGSEEFNNSLSEGRAIAVMKYLAAKGISSDRLSGKGFGKTRPVAGNDTEEGRALNRRVEFVISE